MAGGQGTRMRPYTTVLPKPLLPVGDRPILAILLEQLAGFGVSRVDLCLGYLHELIAAYLEQSKLEIGGMEVLCHLENEPLGTAGALRELEIFEEPFLLMNGDVLTSLDFAALMSGHVESGADLTVTTQCQVTEISSGVLALDGSRITGYTEKPSYSHHLSLGIYALSPAALGQLPPGRADVPDLVKALIAAGREVRAHELSGTWFDIGTADDHAAAVEEIQAHPRRYIAG